MNRSVDDFAFPTSWSSSILNPKGLTKRELFAAMCMQSFLGGEFYTFDGYPEMAEEAVDVADALIAALGKEDV